MTYPDSSTFNHDHHPVDVDTSLSAAGDQLSFQQLRAQRQRQQVHEQNILDSRTRAGLSVSVPFEVQSVLDISVDPGAYFFPNPSGAYPVTSSQADLSFTSGAGIEVPLRQSLQLQQPSIRPVVQSRSNSTAQEQRRADPYRQFQQSSPSTPGMYTGSSTSSPTSSSLGPSAPAVDPPAFEGNVLFWTTRDLRDTTVWADESVNAAYGASGGITFPSQTSDNKRHVEVKLTTPKGYATQTRTSIQITHGAPLGGPASIDEFGHHLQTLDVAEFIWASPTALGVCRLSDGMEYPMVQFLSRGMNQLCTRFPVPNGSSVRLFEWYQDPEASQVYTLCDSQGRAWAKYIGGPFKSKELCPYMQYYWANDDALLVYSVVAITIRQWSERYP